MSINWSEPTSALEGTYICKLTAIGPHMALADHAYTKLEVAIRGMRSFQLCMHHIAFSSFSILLYFFLNCVSQSFTKWGCRSPSRKKIIKVTLTDIEIYLFLWFYG